jgi:hypothetical protein
MAAGEFLCRQSRFGLKFFVHEQPPELASAELKSV